MNAQNYTIDSVPRSQIDNNPVLNKIKGISQTGGNWMRAYPTWGD